MKKVLISIFLLVSVKAFGSALTATITDTPDSQTWNNGSCTLTIYSPNGVPAVNGTPLTAAQKSPACSISGSGVLTATVTDTSTISPAGAQWTFVISPNAASGTFTARMGVTGASPDLSAALSALAASPRFPAGPAAYGYLDAEVSPTPLPGGTYYNVTNTIGRVWSGSAWSSSGGGGAPTTCASGNNYACLNVANTFTAIQTMASGSGPTDAGGTSSLAAIGTYVGGSQIWQFGNVLSSNFSLFSVGPGTVPFSVTTSAGANALVLNASGAALANGLKVGSSQFITGYQGTTGTNLAATTGTFTSGNIRSTDSSGNEIDGGVAATSIALKPVSNANTSATGGTGISAVSCSTASCTNLRGTYTMSAATVSAGTILTLVWPTTTTAYACQVVQNGGAVSLGLGHSVATATGMAVSVAVSVATGSITFDYECTP